MRNPLALLMWLRIQGWARRIGKSAKTTRGKIFFAIGIGMLGLWLMGVIVGQRVENRSKKTTSTDTVPLVMFAATVFICLSSGGKQLSFTPAEIDFLFPGPFTRKQLLLYRLSAAALGSLITSFLFAFWQGQYASSFLAAFIALYALLLFATLVSTLVSLVRRAVGDPHSAQAIRVGGWVLVLGCAAGIIDVLRAVMTLENPLSRRALHLAQNTISGQVILVPFNVLTCVFTAQQVWPDLLLWAGTTLGMILLLLLLVLRLDAYFIESSLDTSRQVAAKIAQVKRGNLFTRTSSGSVTRTLPMLPRLGGVGVIGWRQLTNAMRNFRGVLIFLLITPVAAGPALWGILQTGENAGERVGAAAITIVSFAVPWLLFMLPMMLRFDFRSDIEQMDVLKSLPLAPLAICTGQIIAPSLVLILVIGGLMAQYAFIIAYESPFAGVCLNTSWTGCCRCEISHIIHTVNSEAERRMYTAALGRKNYYGSGSVWSGHFTASLFSIFQTLKLWNINPRKWLTQYLQACAENRSQAPPDLTCFLPWTMSPEQLAQLRYPNAS